MSSFWKQLHNAWFNTCACILIFKTWLEFVQGF